MAWESVEVGMPLKEPFRIKNPRDACAVMERIENRVFEPWKERVSLEQLKDELAQCAFSVEEHRDDTLRTLETLRDFVEADDKSVIVELWEVAKALPVLHKPTRSAA